MRNGLAHEPTDRAAASETGLAIVKAATQRRNRGTCAYSHWCRRLDLRALARHVLSERPRAKARTRVRQPPAHFHRDQWHLLRLAEAGELRQMARRNTG